MGVDTGPNSLVEAGLIGQLEELGWKVNFQGHQQFEDINTHVKEDADIGKMKQPRTVSEVCKRVAKTVEDASRNGSIPLTLGGDHSLVSRGVGRE
jgi:arginase